MTPRFSNQKPSAAKITSHKPSRRSLLLLAVLIAFGLCAATYFLTGRLPGNSPEPDRASVVDGQEAAPESSQHVQEQSEPLTDSSRRSQTSSGHASSLGTSERSIGGATQAPVIAPASAPRPELSPYSRQLVAGLQLNGPLTAERIGEWKTNLQQLVQQGAASVPAIREFLEKNADLDFGAAGSQALGF